MRTLLQVTEAAEARNEEGEEELAKLNQQIQERGKAFPWRERTRNIFNRLREKLGENVNTLKKLGYTLQAVILAVGIVIGAIALKVTNALKAGTTAVGNTLKDISKKVASILPGLIGTIVSFLFKTAGQVVSFIGKNAWLLILFVVAFLIERLTKKRRE